MSREQIVGVMFWRRSEGEPALHGHTPMRSNAPPLVEGMGRIYTAAGKVYGVDAVAAEAMAATLDQALADPEHFGPPEIEI